MSPQKTTLIFSITIWLWTTSSLAQISTTPDVEQETVQLPAFIIEDGKNSWYSTTAPGIEVLSLVSPGETREFVDAFLEARRGFDLIVPSNFQGMARNALTIILWDRSQKNTVSTETIKQYWPQKSRGGFRVERLPNLLSTDFDRGILFCTPPELTLNRWESMRLTPEMAGFLLNSRRPALPRMAAESLGAIYSSAEIKDGRLQILAQRWKWSIDNSENGFPTLEQLFNEQIAIAKEDLMRTRWAWVLFTIWSLAPNSPARNTAFWHFMDRISAGENSIDAFHKSYGIDDKNADKELLAFVRKTQAARYIIDLEIPAKPANENIEVGPAGLSDVIRIKGEWLRQASMRIDSKLEPLRAAYLDEARKTVKKYIENHGIEPEMVRLAGLLEADAGKAESLLDQALSVGVFDIRTGLTLSQLRLARLHSATTSEQLAKIIDPLILCSQGEPPPIQAVQFVAKVFRTTTVAPTPEQLQLLARWAQAFPRQPALLFESASILNKHGQKGESRKLALLALNSPLSEENKQSINALLRKNED